MKKNYLFRTAMCLGVATVLSLCMTAGTYAKYVKTVTGTDSARVAKFNFTVSDGTNTAGSPTVDTITIDLFNTIMDTKDKSAETDIVTTSTLVAPGTMGWVPITVENSGEVTIEGTFDLSASNLAGVPLEFAVSSSDPSGVDFSSLTFKAITDDGIKNGLKTSNLTANGGSETKYLIWRWVYENSDDAGDTALGIAGTATPTVSITCTVTQVD